MANKSKSSSLKWKNPELDLEKAFKKGDFAALITYATENEDILRSGFLSENFEETKGSLRFGAFKMNYFETLLKEETDQTALFKLGELSGYIHLLNSMFFEDNQNKLAQARFEMVLSRFPNHASCLKNIVILLSEKVGTTEKEIIEKVSISSTELQEIMQALELVQLAQYYPNSHEYTLMDFGLRLAKLLKKEIKE